MTDIIHLEPLSPSKYDTYINVGTKAYNQHYLHLWECQDSTPYIESSFTYKVLKQEETDKNTLLFLITKNSEAVGILKFTIDSKLGAFTKKNALYVDKIYILNAHSGMGIGKKVLEFVMRRAKEYGKHVVWLDTMQQGPALNFYIKNGFKMHSERTLEFPQLLAPKRGMWVLTKMVESCYAT